MPKIRRTNLPPALLAHLEDRRHKWGISYDDIALLADWLQANPEVPNGKLEKHIQNPKKHLGRPLEAFSDVVRDGQCRAVKLVA